MSEGVWLEGYYDPALIEDWGAFKASWSMGPHADPDWVWVPGGYYTHEDVKKRLATFEVKGHEGED